MASPAPAWPWATCLSPSETPTIACVSTLSPTYGACHRCATRFFRSDNCGPTRGLTATSVTCEPSNYRP
eukprot:2994261-Pleurochrysis_carterae.AAC.1